jgi:hypothetical protein
MSQAAPSMAERFPFIVLGNKTDKDERVVRHPQVDFIFFFFDVVVIMVVASLLTAHVPPRWLICMGWWMPRY